MKFVYFHELYLLNFYDFPWPRAPSASILKTEKSYISKFLVAFVIKSTTLLTTNFPPRAIVLISGCLKLNLKSSCPGNSAVFVMLNVIYWITPAVNYKLTFPAL